MQQLIDTISQYLAGSGFGQWEYMWPNVVMIGIGLLFIYLAIKKGFEPLLLVPIGFGVLIGNIPYNSNEVALGVYDGPVNPHDLHYYEIETDKLTFEIEGKDVVGVAAALDRIKELKSETQKAGFESELETMSGGEKFLTALYASDVANFESVSDIKAIENPQEGKNLAFEGKAVMVNGHNLYPWSTSKLSKDFGVEEVAGEKEITKPGFINLGQGRYVFAKQIDREGQFPQYPQVWSVDKQNIHNASVFWWLFAGVGLAGFYPPLIFLGIGALTDFGPMLSNPKTLLLGAAAQFGIFGAFLGAIFLGFTDAQAGAIGIIGGADGPTAIFTASQLAPPLLGAIALAAYSYMAMVPIIQPPIMKLLTTREERLRRMPMPKTEVSRTAKVMFPIVGFLMTAMIAPGGLALLGMLFFGNLLRESLVTDRLAKTAQTTFIDIVTILLGVTVGAKTSAANFLTMQTIYIFVLGITAFAVATMSGLLFAKVMNLFLKEKINPLIGAAGVSAVPMAARVVHKVGTDEDPQNFLLMHAMGPNVAGVIGSAVAAGVLLSSLG
ncbi:Glutaconyl-CoA decarboxylase subunit beta [Poriferisphaera corsica]|uniref:Glutaconyl-CoA decarboxylase subunit beta n=1 Tax=Poriferisphaera corsica TaxID=2528020 RepID=A0A517YYU5_9BACT|nr:sodium ion-translocating decarboxylase subunit beta [Poriferisphaera corsica]QDU35385.1 Glutaconyl-CoA decarboxylase subunit beta [Poriferisphaera corsica]